MRILHIVNDVDTGGAQTLIEQLLGATPPGDEAHLLVLMGPASLSRRLEAVATTTTYSGLTRRSLLPVRAMRDVLRLVRDHRIDVVHSHLHQSDLINELTPHGRPRVSTLHSSLDVSSNRLAALVWRTVAALSRRFDAVVACSAAAREFARSLGYRFPVDSIPVVPNGSTTAPAPAPEPVGPPVLVHLARYAPAKDHATLLRAVALVHERFPDVRLVCAGHGVTDENRELTQLLDELGIRSAVQLLGPVDTVRELLRSGHAAVFSSSSEALPMAGIEAISEGVPVITTDVGDTRDLTVDPRAVVAPGQPQALARAIVDFLELPSAQREHVRRESWQLARDRFDAAVTARTYRELYARLLAAH